jgi:hypothetical protein
MTMSNLPAPISPGAPTALKPRRRQHRRAAWIVALAADALQWGLLPMFGLGALSPFNNVLDVVTGAVLWRLLGWHWAFLPTFVAELLPGVDLVPCWTAAVFLATRGKPPEAAPTAPATPAPQP